MASHTNYWELQNEHYSCIADGGATLTTAQEMEQAWVKLCRDAVTATKVTVAQAQTYIARYDIQYLAGLDEVKQAALKLDSSSQYLDIKIEGQIILATIGYDPPFENSYSLYESNPKKIAKRIVTDHHKALDEQSQAWENLCHSYERAYGGQ